MLLLAFKVFFAFMKNSSRVSAPLLCSFVLCDVNIEVKLENIF